MRKAKTAPDSRVLIPVTIGMAMAVVLLWAMVAGEVHRQDLYLEYEAYRASAQILDALRIDASSSPEVAGIKGYGLFTPEGRVILRMGSAPESLELRGQRSFDTVRSETRQASVILTRNVGSPGSIRGRGMGQSMGQGMRWQQGSGTGGSGIPVQPGWPVPPPDAPAHQGLPPAVPGTQGTLPPIAMGSILWVEYSRSGADRNILFLYLGAAVLSAALAGLYLAMLRIYRHNEELRKAELSMRELSQLGEAARTLVHEIKNPLGIIRIQAASLRRTGDERAGQIALIIQEEVQRLADLADRLRDFLKSGAGEPVDLDVDSWMLTYIERWRGNAAGMGNQNSTVHFAAEATGAQIHIDVGRLTQILDNLVDNAVQVSPDVIDLAIEADGNDVTISVSDRGPGVRQEHQDRLFEPFFTTKEKGSGIGLALARKYARQAGGELSYTERPGGGAVFCLHLPRTKDRRRSGSHVPVGQDRVG